MVMEHFKPLVLIFLCCLTVVSCDIGDYDEAVRKGNDFVDRLLDDIVRVRGSDYDPYEMEDSVVGVHKVFMGVNFTGEASFHSGFIRGLTSLNRADGCHLKEEGDKLIIKADLGAGVLDMQYSGTVKLMKFGPTITAHGRIDFIEITMVMSCNSEDGRNGTLMELYIEDIKGESVWITGLGPLNGIASTMVSIAKSLFRKFIYRLVEKKLESHIANNIKNYQFPVEQKTTVQPTEDESIATEPENIQTNDDATYNFIKRN